jgi:hypothetical protein
VQCPLRDVGLPTTEGPFLLCDKSLKLEDTFVRQITSGTRKADVTEDLSYHFSPVGPYVYEVPRADM